MSEATTNYYHPTMSEATTTAPNEKNKLDEPNEEDTKWHTFLDALDIKKKIITDDVPLTFDNSDARDEWEKMQKDKSRKERNIAKEISDKLDWDECWFVDNCCSNFAGQSCPKIAVIKLKCSCKPQYDCHDGLYCTSCFQKMVMTREITSDGIPFAEHNQRSHIKCHLCKCDVSEYQVVNAPWVMPTMTIALPFGWIYQRPAMSEVEYNTVLHAARVHGVEETHDKRRTVLARIQSMASPRRLVTKEEREQVAREILEETIHGRLPSERSGGLGIRGGRLYNTKQYDITKQARDKAILLQELQALNIPYWARDWMRIEAVPTVTEHDANLVFVAEQDANLLLGETTAEQQDDGPHHPTNLFLPAVDPSQDCYKAIEEQRHSVGMDHLELSTGKKIEYAEWKKMIVAHQRNKRFKNRRFEEEHHYTDWGLCDKMSDCCLSRTHFGQSCLHQGVIQLKCQCDPDDRYGLCTSCFQKLVMTRRETSDEMPFAEHNQSSHIRCPMCECDATEYQVDLAPWEMPAMTIALPFGWIYQRPAMCEVEYNTVLHAARVLGVEETHDKRKTLLDKIFSIESEAPDTECHRQRLMVEKVGLIGQLGALNIPHWARDWMRTEAVPTVISVPN